MLDLSCHYILFPCGYIQVFFKAIFYRLSMKFVLSSGLSLQSVETLCISKVTFLRLVSKFQEKFLQMF